MRLSKHHGLGNDFLVLLDPPPDLDAAVLARTVCDRRRGIGADGLLIARPPIDGADVTMELRNADGSRAEMSGNGIRCFAQALWEAGRGAEGRGGSGPRVLHVATDAGLRVVRQVSDAMAAVDMGPVKILSEAPEWVTGTVQAAALVDIGNPHLVLLDPQGAAVDVGARGPEIEATFPDGVNVEWIWPGPGRGEITLKVWERGAGETQACGTGSCAAAKAAAGWGKAPATVVVHNPGGDVTVELGETATLIGPAERVATIEVPWP
ncbi:MAG: diaminopimelate epimerase [Acidimicrobiales bacterium]